MQEIQVCHMSHHIMSTKHLGEAVCLIDGMYKILSCHHNGNLLMHGKLLLFSEGKNENIEDIHVFVKLSNKNIEINR